MLGVAMGGFGGIFFAGAFWPILDRLAPLQTPGAQYGITETTRLPPIQFTGGNEVRVRFTTEYDLRSLCGGNATACWDASNERIIVRNPCTEDQSYDPSDRSYIGTLCHELGHVNGWLHDDASHTSSTQLYPGGARLRKMSP